MHSYLRCKSGVDIHKICSQWEWLWILRGGKLKCGTYTVSAPISISFLRPWFFIFKILKWLSIVHRRYKATTESKKHHPLSKYSAANFCFNKGLCMIWNKGTLSKDNSCLKSCHDLGFHSPNRYESDLSNELLYILVGQETAKIFEVKVRGQTENC